MRREAGETSRPRLGEWHEDECRTVCSAPSRHAKLGELGHDGLAVRRGSHLLVDVGDPAVGPDVESPPRRERLIGVDHAVSGRHLPRRIAEERVVGAKRLREGTIGFRRIDADGEMGRLELADLVPTLTE